MTYSALVTRTITTPNKGARIASPLQYIVLHHFAGTSFEPVLDSWSTGAKQGSCNYAVSNEGQVVGVVPEELRSWTLSDSYFDSISQTFEIENESVNGWTVSDIAEEKVAQVVADLCRRHNIPCNRTHVIGHREVYVRFGRGYATACPGGLEMDKIVARAQALLAGSATADGGLTPIEEEDMTKEEHDTLMEVRRMLGVLLGWPGAANPKEALAGRIADNSAESRRMIAAALTGSPAPAGALAEGALWSQLRKEPTAAGVTIDLDALSAKIIAGLPQSDLSADQLVAAIKLQWSK